MSESKIKAARRAEVLKFVDAPGLDNASGLTREELIEAYTEREFTEIALPGTPWKFKVAVDAINEAKGFWREVPITGHAYALKSINAAIQVATPFLPDSSDELVTDLVLKRAYDELFTN